MKRVEKFYLSEYPDKSYWWRFYYELVNGYDSISYSSQLKPDLNPLKWCVIDILKVVYIILITLSSPFVVIPCCLYDAYKRKERYAHSDFEGVFVYDVMVWSE